jgi:serine/threonine-protein kinase RsbW
MKPFPASAESRFADPAAEGVSATFCVVLRVDMGPPSESAAIPVLNDSVEIEAVREQIVEVLNRFGYGESSTFAIRLALEEALNNAFGHGHRNLPPTEPVTLEYDVSAEQVSIAIMDQGPGFDPDSIPDPTLDENLELPGGRGLLLMRAYMESVEFNEAGNVVRMVYRAPDGEQTGL